MRTIAAYRIFDGKTWGGRPAALLLATLLAAPIQPVMAQTYRFKTVNIPGSTQTSLLSDAGGTIVGWNYDSAGNPTCTLIRHNTYTAISDPNGVQTYCYAISNAGTVVGYYNTSDDAAIGFTYNNGTFSDFSLSGISDALPIAVSTNGIIAGYYYDQNDAPWGFVLKGTKLTTFQISGAANIFPVGVNSHSELTLQEFDMSGNEHCLVGNAPAFTELTAPGATETVCNGINNNGKIAGSYVDGTGAFDGFAYDPATSSYYTIDDPGMADTHIRAITNSETLIGFSQATSSGPRQGLKATGSFP